MDIKKLYDEFKNCACKKEHLCPIDYVSVKSNAVEELCDFTKRYKGVLLVSDGNTYKVCGQRVEKSLIDKVKKSLILNKDGRLLLPNEDSVAEIEKQITSDIDIIIGVGSGVINDLCKYTSFKNDLPYIICATAPSMDGYASIGAAMILGGMKVTVNARPPIAIFSDTAVLKNAPMEMLKAGYGDIIGKFSCLCDWKLSALINQEYFCEKIYSYTLKCAENMKSLAKGIIKREEKAIAELMDSLVLVGVLMSFSGSSRPASGSEHHLSHFFEITGILKNEPYLSHGIDVLYSSYVTQVLREKLIALEKMPVNEKISKQNYDEKIGEIYLSLAKSVIELQEKIGWYNEDKKSIYEDKWNEIVNILKEAPSSQEINKWICDIGLSFSDFCDLYTEKKIEDAVWFAKDLKDRYTVLWLYFELFYK